MILISCLDQILQPLDRRISKSVLGIAEFVFVCVGGTSWIWSSCCCPSWASPWRRLRRLLYRSTPPSSASWECWGSHEVWPPPSVHPAIPTPTWHTPSYTHAHTHTHWSISRCCTFKMPCKAATSPGLPLYYFCVAGLSRVRAGCESTRWHWETQSADKHSTEWYTDKN